MKNRNRGMGIENTLVVTEGERKYRGQVRDMGSTNTNLGITF